MIKLQFRDTYLGCSIYELYNCILNAGKHVRIQLRVYILLCRQMPTSTTSSTKAVTTEALEPSKREKDWMTVESTPFVFEDVLSTASPSVRRRGKPALKALTTEREEKRPSNAEEEKQPRHRHSYATGWLRNSLQFS